MPTALIVLPGALGGLEGSANSAKRLGTDRPVTVLDYRPDDSFNALLERVTEAAKALGNGQFDLLGQSYGGWIAQCVAARWPRRVRRMVLSHSFGLEARTAKYFAIGERLLARLPPAILVPLLRSRIRLALAPVRRAMPELYHRQDEKLAHLVSSPHFIATLAAQQRCLRESLSAPSEPSPHLPVLIIDSANDPLIGAAARARLRQRFPTAQTCCFREAGHVSAIVEADAYSAAVRAFLDG